MALRSPFSALLLCMAIVGTAADPPSASAAPAGPGTGLASLPSNAPEADVARMAARLLARASSAQCNSSSAGGGGSASGAPPPPPAAAAASAERRRLVASAQQGLELLSAGRYHSCGVAVTPATGARRLVCWGASVNTGGDFDNCGQASPPADLAADASTVLQVSAGGYSTCALLAGGTLRCWGGGGCAHDHGQSAPPAAAIAAAGGALSVQVGYGAACALLASGGVSCWGSWWPGISSPPALTDAVSVSTRFVHACAARADGSAVCWGSCDSNCCVSGTGMCSPPTAPALGAVSVETGCYYSTALTASGTIRAWSTLPSGRNSGQVSGVPAGLSGVLKLAAGEGTACALTRQARVACWADAPWAASVAALAGSGNVVNIAMSWWHVCLQYANGSVACTGAAAEGQSAVPAGLLFATPPPALFASPSAAASISMASSPSRSATASQTASVSQTGTPAASISASSPPSPPPPSVFAASCGAGLTWTAPPGYSSVYISAWGAGGARPGFEGGSAGGGAFVGGVARVTPGETLRITVGGQGSSPDCGYAGDGCCISGSGGGFSGVTRWNMSAGDWEMAPLVAAGGGGGGAAFWGPSGSAGAAAPTDPGAPCGGAYAPAGQAGYSPGGGSHQGMGGGGGWVGGAIGVGGQSCAPGLSHVVSAGGAGSAPGNASSPVYQSCYGCGDSGGGLVVLQPWDAAVSPSSPASPTGSAAATSMATGSQTGAPSSSATASRSSTFTQTGTVSLTAAVTANNIISTVAGSGAGGYSGDGGPATSAQLYYPNGIAADAAGNIFVSDSSNYRIRRINPAGTITTFAGTGSMGFSGDGGAATSASISGSWGVAIDAVRGNVIIADMQNMRLRRVDQAGTIMTIAGTGAQGFGGDGGPATSASLNSPWNIVVDTAGNVLFSDAGNSRIRRIDTSGIISTLAGSGSQGNCGNGGAATSACLSNPWGIALDAVGNLFISDVGTHLIRKVDVTGTITTFAGTGTAALGGDGGSATSASISTPFSVAADAMGNVFISDRGNQRLRRIDPMGIISTFAGTGALGYSGDGGAATSATMRYPAGIVVDATGNVLFVDNNNFCIRRVSAAVAYSTSPSCTVSATATITAPPGTTRTTSASTTAIATLSPTVSTSATPSITFRGLCPPDFYPGPDQFCYYSSGHVGTAWLSWPAAQAQCRVIGGTALVTFRSQAVKEFLFAGTPFSYDCNAVNGCWCGLYDTLLSPMRWDSGWTDMTVVNSCPSGYPGRILPNWFDQPGTCATIHGALCGGLQDAPCASNMHPYFCEAPMQTTTAFESPASTHSITATLTATTSASTSPTQTALITSSTPAASALAGSSSATASRSSTSSQTSTPSASAMASRSSSKTASSTGSGSSSSSSSETPSSSQTGTPSARISDTAAATSSRTLSPNPTVTRTQSGTPTSSRTSTPTSTSTRSASGTPTSSRTLTATATPSSSSSGSSSPSSSTTAAATQSLSASATPAFSPSSSSSPSSSESPSSAETATPSYARTRSMPSATRTRSRTRATGTPTANPTRPWNPRCNGQPGQGIFCHTNTPSRTPNHAIYGVYWPTHSKTATRTRTRTRKTKK